MKQNGFGLSMIIYAVAAIAVAGLLTGLYFAVYNKGYAAGERLLIDYKANQAERTVEVIREVEKIVTKVEVKYVDRIKIVKQKSEQIIVKVPVYITKTDDAACELRAGFVRAHDSAATNNDAGPPAESDREPSGVSLSEAMRVVAENYAIGLQWKEQALGCREFYNAIKAKIDGSTCAASH